MDKCLCLHLLVYLMITICLCLLCVFRHVMWLCLHVCLCVCQCLSILFVPLSVSESKFLHLNVSVCAPTVFFLDKHISAYLSVPKCLPDASLPFVGLCRYPCVCGHSCVSFARCRALYDLTVDFRVWVRLLDDTGQTTGEIRLSRFWHNDHERGQMDSFPLLAADVSSEFGDLSKLELWRDSFGLGDSWYLDVITVENSVTRKMYHFPAQRWAGIASSSLRTEIVMSFLLVAMVKFVQFYTLITRMTS